jgi:ubiquinone/menaquinone biosynthesis C-methylase UbiE
MLLPVYDLLTRVLGSARVYDALTARPELTGAHRVLEIGCGTGNLIQRVRKAHPSAQLTGLDPDPRALDIARRKAGSVPGLNFDQGYAQELPYADGAFDRVLSSMMVHHLDDPAKTAAVAEVFRVLEPGGMVLVADVRASDETITRLLHDAGFEHRAIGETRLRVFGPVVLHRGTRPA